MGLPRGLKLIDEKPNKGMPALIRGVHAMRNYPPCVQCCNNECLLSKILRWVLGSLCFCRLTVSLLIFSLLHKKQFTLICKTFLDTAEMPGLTARPWIPSQTRTQGTDEHFWLQVLEKQQWDPPCFWACQEMTETDFTKINRVPFKK